MKKNYFGIITINDNDNIGNRLQNYAVFYLLSKKGIARNIVRKYNCENNGRGSFRVKTHLLLSIFKSFLLSLIGKNAKKYKAKRYLNFVAFNKYIKNGDVLSRKTNYERLNKKYTFFVAGSDQIWNPNLFQNKMYINMLGFADENKRIALAPSVSSDILTKEQEEEFRKYLPFFKSLSCRESQGSKLIANIANRHCETLVDPTLVLTKVQWDAVSKKPSFHNQNKKYILIYFLSPIPEERMKSFREVAIKYDLEIVDIYDKNCIYYSCGPSEFIWLIKHSSLVFTDSFHGSVFSYIYNRPFRVFERTGKETMNSRLINLINKLNLDKKTYITGNHFDYEDLLAAEKYDQASLNKETEAFNNYLDEAIKI